MGWRRGVENDKQVFVMEHVGKDKRSLRVAADIYLGKTLNKETRKRGKEENKIGRYG